VVAGGAIGLISLSLLPKLLAYQETDYISWDDTAPHWFARVYFGSIFRFCKFWNDFEVHGLDKVPSNNCLLVGYHSRCTLDVFMATSYIRPSTIISYMFYTVPGIEWMLNALGCLPNRTKRHGSPEETFINTVVHGSKPVLLLPGGAHECEKMMNERYQIKWKEEPGFARILLRSPDRPGANTSVVPFYTNNCEELYYTTQWWHDTSGQLMRNGLKAVRQGSFWLVPAMTVLGLFSLGLFLVPRSVKVDLYFGNPVVPRPNESPKSFAARVSDAAQELMDSVRAKHQSKEYQDTERTRVSKYLRYPLYGIYIIVQNSAIALGIIFVNICILPFAMLLQFVSKMFFRKATHSKSA